MKQREEYTIQWMDRKEWDEWMRRLGVKPEDIKPDEKEFPDRVPIYIDNRAINF